MQRHGYGRTECLQGTLHCPHWMKIKVWVDTVGEEVSWRQKAEAFKAVLSNLDFQAPGKN